MRLFQLQYLLKFYNVVSLSALSVQSSINSIAFLIAESPPAIIPITILLFTPKVGGHSDASRIPNLPLVPDPI